MSSLLSASSRSPWYCCCCDVIGIVSVYECRFICHSCIWKVANSRSKENEIKKNRKYVFWIQHIYRWCQDLRTQFMYRIWKRNKNMHIQRKNVESEAIKNIEIFMAGWPTATFFCIGKLSFRFSWYTNIGLKKKSTRNLKTIKNRKISSQKI